jgi:hypothetical protein
MNIPPFDIAAVFLILIFDYRKIRAKPHAVPAFTIGRDWMPPMLYPEYWTFD